MTLEQFDRPEKMYDENGNVVEWTDELNSKWQEFVSLLRVEDLEVN